MNSELPKPDYSGLTRPARQRLADGYRKLATLYFERSKTARTPKLRREFFDIAARFQELASRHENHVSRARFGGKSGSARRNYQLNSGYVRDLKLWRH